MVREGVDVAAVDDATQALVSRDGDAELELWVFIRWRVLPYNHFARSRPGPQEHGQWKEEIENDVWPD